MVQAICLFFLGKVNFGTSLNLRYALKGLTADQTEGQLMWLSQIWGLFPINVLANSGRYNLPFALSPMGGSIGCNRAGL
jgi:hypothetical protein